MSLPERSLAIARAAAVALMLAGGTTLSACTLTPLHGAGAGASQHSQLLLRYAEPQTRYEQIVYQTLAGRMGTHTDPELPIVTVDVAVSETRVGLSATASPFATYQVAATANYRVTIGERVLAQGSRSTSTSYQRSTQGLADVSAQTEAEERAAQALGEAVRLALIADLAAGSGTL